MPEFIRLKNKATGAEFSVPAGIEIGDDVVQLDEKPATNGEGVPLPPKYKTSLEPAVEPDAPAGDASAPSEDDTTTSEVVVTEPATTNKARKANTPKE